MLPMRKSDAIKHFGGVNKLAELLDLTRQAIWSWPEEVPDLYTYKLHHLSDGTLPLDEPAARGQP